MGQIRFVTLTGAGEKTSFARMARLSQSFDGVEWGVLYSPTQAGKGGRYPSLDWLEKFAVKANQKRMRIALHLCGQGVKTVLDAVRVPKAEVSPEAQRLFALAERFGRVQLNIRAKLDDVPHYMRLIEKLSRNENRTRVILQWNSHNEAVCLALRGENAFEVLVDSSGGRGVERTDWPDLARQGIRRVGYAGGFGPDNIRAQLELIDTVVPDRPVSVDMEGKLMGEKDCMDLDKVQLVLEQAWLFSQDHRQRAGALWGKGRRSVASLSGLWLDWWVGHALGYNLVVPPLDACKAMLLYRPTGSYESFEPSASSHDAMAIFSEEQVRLTPRENGKWSAWAMGDDDATESYGPDIVTAGLRAVVVKHFGKSVPRNPFV